MNAHTQASHLEPLVLLDRDEMGVATLTLNRPGQFNAINSEMLTQMRSTLEVVAADESIRALIVGGSGRAFCPGHDLKQMLANSNAEFVGDLFSRCCEVMMSLQQLPQPVVAKVHGIATAAGCQLVAACDLAVAAADARFATSGINFGLFCATPGVPVSRNVSRKRAFEMLITGEFIDAATALDWGLVNCVVPVAGLDAAARALAAKIIDKPRALVASGKQFFYRQLELTQLQAYEHAATQMTCYMLDDIGQEGVTAFTEKRKPRWK